MRHLENFNSWLLENTLFDPGIFQMTLRDALGEPPKGSIYVGKQLAKGTVPHIKHIAKGLGVHVIRINCAKVNDIEKWIMTVLKKNPGFKTLVIVENLELAQEENIEILNNLIDTRKINGVPISNFYYFTVVHLVDNSVISYKELSDKAPGMRSPLGTTEYRQKETDSTI